MDKLDILKKKLYFKKLNILFNKAFKAKKIMFFDDEIYEKMSDTIIACLPVSLYIKYSKYLFPSGTCYERSLYMFLALDNALLVRGEKKNLKYNFGIDASGHGWIELGNFVYDPSMMLRFDKDTYYSLYECSNVTKIDKQTYLLQHKGFVDSYVSHDFNEFRPNGKRRLELGVLIYQLKTLSKMLDDEQFTKDLEDYLMLIEYDEKQIYEEREKVIPSLLLDESVIETIGR